MDMFALDDEVARLELALSPLRGPGRLAVLEPLAWYLRQRDTMRALALADEVETLFASSPSEPDSDPDRQRIAARLRLVRGEASWMLAKLDAAQALTDPALQMFSALDDAAGSADAHWLLALIAADRGDHARRDAELEAAASQARRAGDDMRARIAEAALAIWTVYRDLDRLSRSGRRPTALGRALRGGAGGSASGCRTLGSRFFGAGGGAIERFRNCGGALHTHS